MKLKFQENVKIWAEKMCTGIQLHAQHNCMLMLMQQHVVFLSWFFSIIFILYCSSMCGQWESNVSVCCIGLGFADHRPSIFPNYFFQDINIARL